MDLNTQVPSPIRGSYSLKFLKTILKSFIVWRSGRGGLKAVTYPLECISPQTKFHFHSLDTRLRNKLFLLKFAQFLLGFQPFGVAVLNLLFSLVGVRFGRRSGIPDRTRSTYACVGRSLPASL